MKSKLICKWKKIAIYLYLPNIRSIELLSFLPTRLPYFQKQPCPPLDYSFYSHARFFAAILANFQLRKKRKYHTRHPKVVKPRHVYST